MRISHIFLVIWVVAVVVLLSQIGRDINPARLGEKVEGIINTQLEEAEK